MSNWIVEKKRRQPLYDFHPVSGAILEVFFADAELAAAFGLHSVGWVWWRCKRGLTPDAPPRGPHTSAYRAYREAITS